MMTNRPSSENFSPAGMLQAFKVWGSLSLSLFLSTTLALATTDLVLAQANFDANLSDRQSTTSTVPPVPSGLNVIYVDATNGSDTSGNGSQQSPYRTITYATQVAASGTIIQLLPGVYSEASGEVFPLKVKAGQILRGDETSLGEGILISGGGTFISPTLARQNITMLAETGSEIRGVSMRNEGRRGYALWLESTAPKVFNNSFVGSIHDGIFLTGEANALIQGNRFYKNGANGISVLGTSAPLVINNLFQETGFGITIDKKSAPTIQDNRILQNRTGVIVGGEARPKLRGNQITQNLQTGLTAVTRATPDLGVSGDPGNNVFQGNGELDIQNSTPGVLVAFGNQLSGGTKGQVDVSGQASIPAVATSAPAVVSEGSLTLPSVPVSATPAPTQPLAAAPTQPPKPASPTVSVPPTQSPFTLQSSGSTPVQGSPTQSTDSVAVTGVPPLSQPVATAPQSTPRPTPVPTSTTTPQSTPVPVTLLPSTSNTGEFKPVPFTPDGSTPPPGSGSQVPATTQQPTAAATLPPPVSVVATPRPVAPAPTQPVVAQTPLVSGGSKPVLDITTLLPPPGVRQQQAQSAPTPAPPAALNPVPPSAINPAPVASTGSPLTSNSSGAQFRILVTPTPNNDLKKLQSLVPGAVETVFNGRSVLEAGLYDNRNTAQEILDKLLDAGFEAVAEMIFP